MHILKTTYYSSISEPYFIYMCLCVYSNNTLRKTFYVNFSGSQNGFGWLSTKNSNNTNLLPFITFRFGCVVELQNYYLYTGTRVYIIGTFTRRVVFFWCCCLLNEWGGSTFSLYIYKHLSRHPSLLKSLYALSICISHSDKLHIRFGVNEAINL